MSRAKILRNAKREYELMKNYCSKKKKKEVEDNNQYGKGTYGK